MRIAAALAVALVAPAAALAQGVAIEHKPIGCVVAGKYPVFNACFTPASELARARVYFKAEASPHWYYVDMKPETPCFTGTLPRPKKEIGGLSYYVEATDRAFNPARTDETATRVVGNQMECEKDVPVAPFVDKATVIVGSVPGAPIVPLGFATTGGLPAAAAAGIIGGGAAAAGAVVATNNDDSPTTTVTPGTTTPTTPPSTTPPPTTPPTTAPPTTPPATNGLPTLRLEYNPSSGESPLNVRFNACGSSDPDPGDVLRFTFDFENDGTVDASGGPASCRQEHTYTGSGGDRFTARVCVNDRVTGHEDVCQNVRVTLTSACVPGDESGPEVTWLEPNNFSSGFLTASVAAQTLKVDASDPSGVTCVEFYAYSGGDRVGGQGTVSSKALPAGLVGTDCSGPPFAVTFDANSCSYYYLEAIAYDSCGNQSEPESNYLYTTCTEASQGSVPSTLTWVSELDVRGGSGQVVLNGTDAFFPGAGRANGRAAVKAGENRLEAQLVTADGAPGTWRLELSGESSLVRGSIKVLAGEAVSVDATSVTFRLQGRAGERVVVSFRTK